MQLHLRRCYSHRCKPCILTMVAFLVWCRNGHMYAHRLLTALAKTDETWDVQDGVVRISMLHYNTPAEVDHLLAALDEILGVEE